MENTEDVYGQTAHLLDQAPGCVEVNVVVGQQPGAGRGQVLDVLP